MEDQPRPGMIFIDQEALHNHIFRSVYERELDFIVCSVVSHWHALGVDALVHRVKQDNNRVPSGIIVVSPHPKDGFVISERDFICRKFASVEFLHLNPVSGTKRSVVLTGIALLRRWLDVLIAIRGLKRNGNCDRREICMASLLQPNIGLLGLFQNERLRAKYQPVFCLLDEGAGQYMSRNRSELQGRLDSQKGKRSHDRAGEGIQTKIILAVNRLLTSIAKRNIETENLALFDFDSRLRRLVLRDSVAGDYRHVIAEHEWDGEIKQCRKERPLALFLPQPFAEYGQVPLATDKELLEGVINVILEAGYDVAIKPHPRETAGKYDSILARFDSRRVGLLEQRVAVETLFKRLSPACVVGYSSTTLLVAKALYDVPTISVMGILVKEAPTEYLKVTAADFEELSKGFCVGADGLAELKELLISVGSNSAGTALTRAQQD